MIPKNYDPLLNIRETEIAIKLIKDTFEKTLAKALHLTRVSAPLFVFPETGLNDNLSGVERPVRFDIKALAGREVEIVHSLAKWKRFALKKYGFAAGQGLYTDMNAIRRDEELDNLHSIYVDQWDWEFILDKADRTEQTLETIVKKIFSVFKTVETAVTAAYPAVKPFLPKEVTFMTTQALYDQYPGLSAKEREDAVCREYGAVFLTKIGGKLSNGEKHDDRAPDYDDWQLNGDLLFYYPVLSRAMEVSSMGIRVDEDSLLSQLEEAGEEKRKTLPFHADVLNRRLPYTAGGGLGQSRICMFFLNKAHIGEVQASMWSDEMIQACAAQGIHLL
jgi:aspartate--ammonia ligase